MVDVTCQECDTNDNLIKCDNENCVAIFCDDHAADNLEQCQHGCGGFFCHKDLERTNYGMMKCATCADAGS